MAPSWLTAHALNATMVELRLHSEDGLNRITVELLRELAGAPRLHPEARRFVLTGNAHHFSAGADLSAIASLDGASAWAMAREGRRWLEQIAGAGTPFVAAIAGNCVGGGLDLALACRARVCAPGAYLGHHGAKLGLVTGWGGTQRLPPLIGRARTLEHLLSARGWTAAAALEQGLVQAVCPPAELRAQAAGLAC
ncbi:MAG TPA: enoyl-CoA hydratase/isomerase family protein [Candidatus Sulfopaludibacter sp.]|nr:enoyl-CoA hydratase/isomerase family protein [Candidatus Sulfopaludibacter sp.]